MADDYFYPLPLKLIVGQFEESKKQNFVNHRGRIKIINVVGIGKEKLEDKIILKK